MQYIENKQLMGGGNTASATLTDGAPTLSIITINYNNLEGLRSTMQSVARQSVRTYEYIVVDGGSDDGSREYIERHASLTDKWVSERDGGVYNAQNKGVRMSSGRYCLFLNSGDFLVDDDVIERVLTRLEETDCDILQGTSVMHPQGWVWYAPERYDINVLLDSTYQHQSSFIRRSLLLEHPYDETLKIVSDWKLYLHLAVEHHIRYVPFDGVVSQVDTGGISFREYETLNFAERDKVMDEIGWDTLLQRFRWADPRVTAVIVRHRHSRRFLAACSLAVRLMGWAYDKYAAAVSLLLRRRRRRRQHTAAGG